MPESIKLHLYTSLTQLKRYTSPTSWDYVVSGLMFNSGKMLLNWLKVFCFSLFLVNFVNLSTSGMSFRKVIITYIAFWRIHLPLLAIHIHIVENESNFYQFLKHLGMLFWVCLIFTMYSCLLWIYNLSNGFMKLVIKAGFAHIGMSRGSESQSRE